MTPAPTQRRLGFFLCALAMATVGSTVVASRLMTAGLPPFTAAALRFAVAAPVFWLLMRATGTAWPRPQRRDGLLLLAQAIAGSAGYTVLLLLGTRLAPAADAGVVAGTLPAVAALVAVLALGERPSRPLMASVALATAGVAAISLPQALGIHTGADAPGAVSTSPARALLGHALVLGAVLCEAVFILLNKRLRAPIPPLAQAATMNGLGLLVCLVPALLERAWAQPVPASALLATIYYALVPGVLGFWLWFAGSARLSGAEASLMAAAMPVSALVLAAWVLGETITPWQMAGCALVLAAMAGACIGRR